MTEVELVPWMAGLMAFAGVLYVSIADKLKSKQAWLLPCGLSLLFFVISLRALLGEGPLGFWTEHTRNLWGNQIWLDLLLGVSAAFSFAVPRARAMRMNVVLWAILCLATGSIGLYAFIGRLLYLESRNASA